MSRQTRDTAALYGLHDRCVLAPGMKADLNLIDLDGLALATPEDGEPTGALPGRLIRGTQPTPRP